MTERRILPHPVLVTGANGFIGKRLVELLPDDRFTVRRCTRRSGDDSEIAVGDIGPDTDWKQAVAGMRSVVHLAGRAHVLDDHVREPLEEFRRVNVEGTLQLARQAAESGVERFVFVSSIGVNGNQNRSPFTEKDSPNPVEPYAVSKLEAEQGLRKIGYQSGMDITIVRPPLVYGPGAPGNFDRLIRLVAKGWPLPLGAIRNRRSFLALDNLVDFVVTCLEHPAAAGHVFLVGDGEDLSTPDLLRHIGQALHRPVRLVPVPVWLLKLSAAVIGRRAVVDRLCGSLQVDCSKARDVLGWTPPLSLDQALRDTAQHFLESRAR